MINLISLKNKSNEFSEYYETMSDHSYDQVITKLRQNHFSETLSI